MVKGDVDKDGLEDIFIGGEKDKGASLFIQKKDGNFIKMKSTIFETAKGSHDTEAVIFDANGDGDCTGTGTFRHGNGCHLDRSREG